MSGPRPQQAHRTQIRDGDRRHASSRPPRWPRRRSRASARSRSACTRSTSSRAISRSRRPRASTRLAAGSEELPPLAGVPVAFKDNMNLVGTQTTCSSPHPRRLRERVRLHRRAPASSRRRAADRQVQHGRVRIRLLHGELGVRRHAQPVGPRPRARRLVGRLGGGGRGGHGDDSARLRHRRLDPPARRAHRARSR